MEQKRGRPEQLAVHHATISAFAGGESAALVPEQRPSRPKPIRHIQPKVGRNDPCYCGSGKKFKHCHGRG